MSSLLTLRKCQSDHSFHSEPPPDGDRSDSGSDEEVEFAKTEGDEDRRKTLLDSIQTGDSSLDQLRKQSKLDDYVGIFHLPNLAGEGHAAVQDQPADHTKVIPTTNSEVVDLSLSTAEEGDDDRSEDVIVATDSGPRFGGCDIQQTVTSTSVTSKPDRTLDGGWACPICTLYAHSPLPPHPFHRQSPFPVVVVQSITNFSHRKNQPMYLSCDACGGVRPTGP